jgi:hypothetical protein
MCRRGLRSHKALPPLRMYHGSLPGGHDPRSLHSSDTTKRVPPSDDLNGGTCGVYPPRAGAHDEVCPQRFDIAMRADPSPDTKHRDQDDYGSYLPASKSPLSFCVGSILWQQSDSTHLTTQQRPIEVRFFRGFPPPSPATTGTAAQE